MAVYSLMGSYRTVQVLSPTLVNDVIYCTIETHPSSVIASMPIPIIATDVFSGNPELTAFAEAIERVMALPEVVAGLGSQTLDPNGLLRDTVVFTVQYVPPGSTGTSITAEATIPVASLNFEDGQIGATLWQSVEARIEAVYNDLKAAASG